MTNKIKYGIIENVNIIHEPMLEIAMRQEVGLRWICGIGVMAATTDSKSVAVRRRDSTSLSRTMV